MEKSTPTERVFGIFVIISGLSLFTFIISCIRDFNYKEPLNSGVIIDKREVLDGKTYKSMIHYETRKRFTIRWDKGVTTDLFPTDNDYYTLSIGSRVSYYEEITKQDTLTRINIQTWLVVSGMIMFISLSLN